VQREPGDPLGSRVRIQEPSLHHDLAESCLSNQFPSDRLSEVMLLAYFASSERIAMGG